MTPRCRGVSGAVAAFAAHVFYAERRGNLSQKGRGNCGYGACPAQWNDQVQPDISSDFQFMNKLQRNLNSVEIIRQHTADVRSRNKKAVAIAAVVGFIVGFLFSMSLPFLNDAVSSWQLTLPQESVLHSLANNFTTIAWLIIGGTSVIAALNTYELSLSLLKSKEATAGIMIND